MLRFARSRLAIAAAVAALLAGCQPGGPAQTGLYALTRDNVPVDSAFLIGCSRAAVERRLSRASAAQDGELEFAASPHGESVLTWKDGQERGWEIRFTPVGPRGTNVAMDAAPSAWGALERGQQLTDLINACARRAPKLKSGARAAS